MFDLSRRNVLLGASAIAGAGLVGCSEQQHPVPKINGVTAPKFELCRTAFEGNFAIGYDVGSALCVTHNDEVVVDLWAGWMDAAKTKPWQEDSIVNVFSSTKTMTALCALLLADRGELSFDDPVSKFWPEFAANGKADVKVAHLLSHTAGLPTWDDQIDVEVLYDWEQATSLLANQTPMWEPGTASGYHAITQGFLVGEVVRRVSGQSLGTFFARELAEPMGADFHIGTPAEADGRTADMLAAEPQPIMDFFFSFIQSDLMKRVLGNPAIEMSDVNGGGWRRAEIPAANGHGSARGAAQIQSLVSHGGAFQGKTILSEAGARAALKEQIDGTDLVLGLPLRHGTGYGLQMGPLPSPNPSTCFWYGAGGSMVMNDLENRLTITFVMNQMLPGLTMTQRTDNIIEAVYGSLGQSVT
jgi:CubicO group peptidase (beta-lactamase class C family)